jgi:hypothetical protein
MPASDSKLTRIGVFYDGNFFFHVSNYYHYSHERRARISVRGLHEFIRRQVAESEGSDVKYCQMARCGHLGAMPDAVQISDAKPACAACHKLGRLAYSPSAG